MMTMPGLDAVTDADREWFEAHPARRYRLRPTELAEMLPGEVIGPGSRTVVLRTATPGLRFRLRVGRPLLRLRHDTDRCCRELIRGVERAGHTINGIPLSKAIRLVAHMQREVPAPRGGCSLRHCRAILPRWRVSRGGPAYGCTHIRRAGMNTQSRPNGSKVLILELRERTSAKGTRYLAGWMGKARLVAFAGEPDETGHRVWSIYAAEPEPHGDAQRDGRG
jgi:hypothetical protein